MMQPTQLNLHDVIERVRRLILAEFLHRGAARLRHQPSLRHR
jgi:nitrogen-specific signal transduction histidine kinase